MTLKLTDEMRHALESREPTEALRVDDDETNIPYVLVRLDVFERMQKPTWDDGEPDPREFYPAFLGAVQEDIDAPGMEAYDEYDSESPAT